MIVSEQPLIRMYNADSLEAMKGMEDNAYELAIVDPEYGIGMDNSNKRTKPSRPNSYTLYPDFRYKEASWDQERVGEDAIKEIFRVSKNQVMFGANYYCHLLPEGCGWLFWNKKNGANNCFSDGEFAFTSKGVQSRYFSCSQFDGLRGGLDRIHPTEKPVKLYKWLLTNYATEGDRILDTHGGSGSIAIACYDMGFDLDWYELDTDYYEAAVNRFKEHIKQGQLFRPEPKRQLKQGKLL